MKQGAIFLGILVPGLVVATLLNILAAYFDFSNHWIGPVCFGLFLAFGTHPFIYFFEHSGEGSEDSDDDTISPAL